MLKRRSTKLTPISVCSAWIIASCPEALLFRPSVYQPSPLHWPAPHFRPRSAPVNMQLSTRSDGADCAGSHPLVWAPSSSSLREQCFRDVKPSPYCAAPKLLANLLIATIWRSRGSCQQPLPDLENRKGMPP